MKIEDLKFLAEYLGKSYNIHISDTSILRIREIDRQPYYQTPDSKKNLLIYVCDGLDRVWITRGNGEDEYLRQYLNDTFTVVIIEIL